jgi:hypothetical protein
MLTGEHDMEVANLTARVIAILITPKSEWPVIADSMDELNSAVGEVNLGGLEVLRNEVMQSQ